jgi:hypothetical protein
MVIPYIKSIHRDIRVNLQTRFKITYRDDVMIELIGVKCLLLAGEVDIMRYILCNIDMH